MPEDQAIYQLLYTGTGYLGLGDRTIHPGFPERALYQSADGETWTPLPLEQSEETHYPNRIVNAPSGYLLMGETSRTTGHILSSPDGTNWSSAYDSQVALKGISRRQPQTRRGLPSSRDGTARSAGQVA